jgi:hypothetical protein
MDVIDHKPKNDDDFEPKAIYQLTEDDVENILVATDALYWTILQILRSR